MSSGKHRSPARRQVAIMLGGLVLVGGGAAAVMPVASAVDPVPWPAGVVYTTDLIAGQHTDVGSVSIKYDATSVSVKTVVDTGQWCMTEVKAAAGPMSAFTNKPGNPVPGKFPLKQAYQPCVTDSGWLSMPKPAGWDYTVAVHATVTDLASAVTTTISSEAGDRMYGPAATPGALPGPVSAVQFPGNPAWADVPGAKWISTELPADIPVDPSTGYVPDSYRKVVETFTVSGYLFGVTPLKANSDNAEEVFLNATSIGSDGQMAPGPVTDDQKYKTVVDYPMALKQGTNTLEIVFRNYGVPNLDPPYTAAQNPTGLAYHASYKVSQTETAWAAGAPWGGANWAMFVKLPSGTSVTVDSTVPEGVSMTLPGGTYFVVASGTWTNRINQGGEPVDASCTKESGGPWATQAVGFPDDLLELQINQTDIDWGACAVPSHVYTTTWVGGITNLRIYDGENNQQIPGWFSDNEGDLTVVLYKIG